MNLEKFITASAELKLALGVKSDDPREVFKLIRDAASQVVDATGDIAAGKKTSDLKKIEKCLAKLNGATVKDEFGKSEIKSCVISVAKLSVCVLKIVGDILSGSYFSVPGDIQDSLPTLIETYKTFYKAFAHFANYCKADVLPKLEKFGHKIEEKVFNPIEKFFKEKFEHTYKVEIDYFKMEHMKGFSYASEESYQDNDALIQLDDVLMSNAAVCFE